LLITYISELVRAGLLSSPHWHTYRDSYFSTLACTGDHTHSHNPSHGRDVAELEEGLADLKRVIREATAANEPLPVTLLSGFLGVIFR
jgi:hypothetical protein